MRFLSLCLVLLLAACKKDGPTQTLNDPTTPNATVLASGRFQNGPYGSVMGIGRVVKTPAAQFELVLDSFTTSNGPDLYVYLSKEIQPVNFIEAGKLRSTNGRQVYPLASMPDLMQYKYICIHCKAYNHLFGYAPLP
jgi:hypothetical protein